MAKRQPIGRVPAHRIAVIDGAGNVRGHVGKTATAATASRFLGTLGAKLGTKDGRKAWIGPKKPAC